MTRKQKDAIAAYLAIYKTQKEKDPEFDQWEIYSPMYFKAIDGMRAAGFSSAEIDTTIIYREELLAKLVTA